MQKTQKNECWHTPMPGGMYVICLEEGHLYPSHVVHCQDCGAPLISSPGRGANTPWRVADGVKVTLGKYSPTLKQIKQMREPIDAKNTEDTAII